MKSVTMRKMTRNESVEFLFEQAKEEIASYAKAVSAYFEQYNSLNPPTSILAQLTDEARDSSKQLVHKIDIIDDSASLTLPLGFIGKPNIVCTSIMYAVLDRAAPKSMPQKYFALLRKYIPVKNTHG